MESDCEGATGIGHFRTQMNNLHEQNIEKFEELISPWACAYLCAEISYVGLKTIEGPKLLFGRIVLFPTRAGLNTTTFDFETEHLIAARFISDTTSNEMRIFLANARKGRLLTIDRKKLDIKPEGNLSAYFSPIHHPVVTDGPRLPSLQISGTNRHNLIVSVNDPRLLDWELKAAEKPFNNLDELLTHCNLPTQIQMGDMTMLEIVARSPVMISETSTIIDNDVIIECHLAAALDIDKLRLGYKVLYQGSMLRESVMGNFLDWREEGDIKVGTYRTTIGDAAVLQSFVSYAGVSHHQWWVTDPLKRFNPRHAIHQVFDDDLELLKRMLLKPETDKPYVFENAVSTLMNLLGFSVSNYGRIPKLQRGPDVIAISPSDDIQVIECTIGLINENDKLSKLVQRSKLIRDKLNITGYAFLQLQAIVMTPLPREEVKADLDTAGNYDIAVICKEEIEELLNQINLPLHADKIFDDTKKLVPNMTQGTLFGHNI